MDIKDKMRESQSSIIDALAECEEQIGALYEEFSKSVQDSRSFWENLAREENQHAALLRTLKKNLAKGSIFFNLGHFSDERLGAMTTLVNAELTLARCHNTNHARALETAVKIEDWLLESKFYDFVTSDSQEFQIIARKLSGDTQRHINLIQNAVAALPRGEDPKKHN